MFCFLPLLAETIQATKRKEKKKSATLSKKTQDII